MKSPLEQQILAAILVYGRRALEQVPDLSTTDFQNKQHKDIFQAIARVDADGLAVDYVTVDSELCGNSAAVHELSQLMATDELLPSMLPAYVRKLRTLNALGRAKLAAREILSLEEAPNHSPEELLAEAQRLAQGILAGAVQSDAIVSLREVADAEIGILERIRAGEKEPDRLDVGLPDLDQILYGFEPGSLVVIGGETSSGKSALCGQITAHHAKRGTAVVFVTSEMTHRQMLIRIVSGLSDTSISTLINRRAAAESNAGKVLESCANLPIYFQRSFPPRIAEAVAAIRTAKARHGIKLAVIDYAQRLAESDYDNQEQAIARIAHESKNLALELGIVVIAAAQVNRQIAHRTDPRPKLADLRGSGRLEQDADVVLFTHQPARHGKPGDPEIIVAKNRNGRLGTVKVSFRGETCTFAGLGTAEAREAS
jgi:replicative DNA helicase